MLHNCFFSLVFLVFSCPLATCAQAGDTATRSAAIANAVIQYKQFTKPPTALYNGKQYVDYLYTIHEEQPFFASPDYVIGKLMYDNTLYEGIPLRYDIVMNELITIDHTKFFDLSLFNDKISYFEIHGHTFIRIDKDSSKHSLNSGFYDRLYNGRSVTLLKKEEKKILTNVTERDGVRNVIESKQNFYMSVNNDYHRTNSKNAVLEVLYKKQDELKQYIRKNKLHFSKDEIDEALIKIADYYESLSK